ncbi:hypothetical protein BDN72DRAFT_860794 [Pluteus cervinus]|uniref:Uncharacterized protein n=1 Tax=Pluteus cervinus TaxID=181527 RepID=A0ACD3AIE6_9AGAR|nr:hypothetical protein BDN72DRAFT_860794 [Pluteus cervinus]
MPADRRRSNLNDLSDDAQMMWTNQNVDAMSVNNGIAFAPNVTPITFNDPPPLVDATPCESSLFPSVNECPAPRRSGHGKRKPENHIPRPPNAFILFRSSFIKSQHVSNKVETNHSTLSKIIGLTWQNLPLEERQIWHHKAKVALSEHKLKFPDYAFRPLHGKGKDKRKVREVGPKDLKRCEKIAELLVLGKKGEDLDVAIKEFDKHHAPEVVTRFEAPITAQTFEKVSSNERKDSLTKKTRGTSRKPSASSSEALSTPSSSPSPPPSLLYFSTPPPEQMRGLRSEPCFDMVSFGQYPCTPDMPTNHLDSPNYPFDRVDAQATLAYQQHYGPAPSAPTTAGEAYTISTDCHSPQLSIDTSLIPTDAWTRDSSPASTASSHTSYDTPSPNFYDPYIDTFSTQSQSHAPHYPLQEQSQVYAQGAHYSGCDAYVDTVHQPHAQSAVSEYFGASLETYVAEHEAKPLLASSTVGLDYQTYMGGVPQYSL